MSRLITLTELNTIVKNLKLMMPRVLTMLADFPKFYAGSGGRYVKVKATENGVEFGRRIFVSNVAPTPADGEDGDLWFGGE